MLSNLLPLFAQTWDAIPYSPLFQFVMPPSM